MMCQTALYFDSNPQRLKYLVSKLDSLYFTTSKANNIQAARSLVEKTRFRLVLIDYESAGDSTVGLCRFIRSASVETVIIVLMADAKPRIEEELFDLGVNDVVVGKQATPKILVKRIKARLTYNRFAWSQVDTIRLKNTIIDFNENRVWCDGKMKKMPGILAQLLRYFVDNAGRIITRDELRDSPIWADSICTSADEGGKTFDVNVSKLRKIIEPNPASPEIIKCIRGRGWKIPEESIW